jgi:hypothetical protein
MRVLSWSRCFKMLGVVVLLAGTASCKKGATSTESSSGQAPTMNVRPDSELFAGNDQIAATLQQEIKRQFLQAVQTAGVLKQLAGENSNVWLTEIAIARVEKSTLDIDASVSGGVAVKERKGESGSAGVSDGAGPLGGSIATSYHLQRSSYNLTFAFQERVSSTTEGEIIRLPLSAPLVIEENIKVMSRVKLNISAIKALPPAVGTIVARFFDDISINLDSGMTFERSSDVSTRMYFRSGKGNMTELMRDLAADIGVPLCKKLSTLRGSDDGACAVQLPTLTNPVAELEKRISTPVLPIAACEKTTIREGLTPIYKLSFAVSPTLQIFQKDSKAYLYTKEGVSWKKMDWATILGINSKAACKLSADSTKKCITMKYGANFFDDRCAQINSKKLTIGVKEEDKPIIY